VPEPTLTDRLLLTPIDPADEVVLGRLFAIQADPATWTHLPEGVETDLSQTRSLAEDHARSWREQGLGWWAVGLREATAGFPEGAIVGLGGAGVRRPELPAWNLGYRLTPAVWGRGLAGELAAAALRAARLARPELPVTARALARNPASWHVLERVGLSLAWEGPAPASAPLTRGLTLRVYADRPLPDELLGRIAALG